MFGKQHLILTILLGCMLVCGFRPACAQADRDVGAELMHGDPVVAMCLADAPEGSDQRRSDSAEQLTFVVVDICGHITAAQVAQDAADVRAMESVILEAEDRVSLPAPAKINRALQLKKLLAWTLDRLTWGGALFALGAALAWLARRKQWTTEVAKLLMSLSMVCFGCAYALLLPVLAFVIIVGFAAYKARALVMQCFGRTVSVAPRLLQRRRRPDLALEQLDFFYNAAEAEAAARQMVEV